MNLYLVTITRGAFVEVRESREVTVKADNDLEARCLVEAGHCTSGEWVEEIYLISKDIEHGPF